MKTSRANKGQFSIIAALLVSVILVTSVISTYSMVRNAPIQDSPKVLSAIGEMNTDIKRILDFTIGYYGSILKVTGNSTYAQNLTTTYLSSGLVNIARSHPEWNPSFTLSSSEVSTRWYMPESYSSGTISVTYSLDALGIEGVKYETSSALDVTMLESDPGVAKISVTRDNSEPELGLTRENFWFYKYNDDSTWELVNPTADPVISDEVYIITLPAGIDSDSYSVQVEDNRGLLVPAFYSHGSVESGGVPHYTYNFDWGNGEIVSIYDSLSTDTMVIELLQNGTMRWLDQNLTTQVHPIPPIPIKALHVNTTIGGVSHEVPFQVEDWASDYKVPLGLAGNASLFKSNNMIVFLVNNNVQNVTLWWDGRDTATQTSYAWKNNYFNDDPDNGILRTNDLTLLLDEEYLYVNGHDGLSGNYWSKSGTSPYLGNSDSSSIHHNGNGQTQGWFSFEDLTGLKATDAASKSVVIEFECLCSNYGDDYFEFRVDDGTQIHGPYVVNNLDGWYSWKTYDISSIINNLEEINDIKIEVSYRQNGGGSSDVYIRRARLLIDFWVTSAAGDSYTKADLLRINGESPVYGADPAYVIYNGTVRDIVQQEAEWESGITSCPNIYSQIVLTLPANTTYYTYALRTVFVDSSDVTGDRTLNELSALQLSLGTELSETGECITENGINATGFSIPSYLEATFDYTPESAHHWSEFLNGTVGAGVMFTDRSNTELYRFDSIAGTETGALVVDKQDANTAGYIEVNPVELASAQFDSPLDVTWYGAVVAFDGEPIYRSSDDVGLWVMVAHPPSVTLE